MQEKRRQIGQYIRDNKRRKIGYLLAYKDRENKIRIGWSLYAKNKETIPFDRYIAKSLAYSRAEIDESYPPSISKDMDRFLRRCKRYF